MSNNNYVEELADRSGLYVRSRLQQAAPEPPVEEDLLDIQGVILTPSPKTTKEVKKIMPEEKSEVVLSKEWSQEVLEPTPEPVADSHVENLDESRKRKYEEQEKKRAPKIQIDQRLVLVSWLTSVAIAFVTSAVVSFNGITSVANFVGLSAPWMASLFFFFVELMYLIFLVAYLILASRVDENGKPERTAGAIWGMVFFAGVAVAANAFHTLDYWEWGFTEPRAWAGVVLSVAAPLAIISASKMASRVVFARAIQA
jgi:hypothetical protein